MKTILMLDLEETVIDNWNSKRFLDDVLAFIHKAIERHNTESERKIDALGLFSYAVKNSIDLETFNTELKPHLELALGLEFDPRFCFTIETIAKCFYEAEGVELHTFEDFRNYCGNKAKTFFTVMPDVLSDEYSSAILLDDTVKDADLIFKNTGYLLKTRCIVPQITTTEDEGKLSIGTVWYEQLLI